MCASYISVSKPLDMAMFGDKAFMEVMKIEEGCKSGTLCKETLVWGLHLWCFVMAAQAVLDKL